MTFGNTDYDGNKEKLDSSDLEEGSKRKQVYDYVKNNPSVDAYEISEECNVGLTLPFKLYELGLLSRTKNPKNARWEYEVKK